MKVFLFFGVVWLCFAGGGVVGYDCDGVFGGQQARKGVLPPIGTMGAWLWGGGAAARWGNPGGVPRPLAAHLS